MAGGAGSRLGPLTTTRAKPAIPLAGVYRLVDVALTNCAHSGMTDVWVVQQYEPHSLGEHLAGGRPWDLDRSYGGLQVLHPHQSADGDEGFDGGNVDSLWNHRAAIERFDPKIVMVLSADAVYRLDYSEVVAGHLAAASTLTLVTTTVAKEDVSRFGNVVVDADGLVTDFAYKPDEPLSDVVTTEVFVYDAKRLFEVLAELADGDDGDDGGLGDYGDRLVPRLVDEGAVREHRLDGYWRDLGTVESYWSCHQDLLDDPPAIVLDDPAWPLRTSPAQRLPARVGRDAEVDRSLLSPGCRVQGRVVRSVLGPGVVVAEGAEVIDSVLLEDVVLGRGATVATAVLDRRTQVGAGATVGAPLGGAPATDDAIVVVGADVHIRAGTTVAPGEQLES